MAIAIANLTSYVTVAEADAYLAGSIRAAGAWQLVSPSAKKERALVSATRLLQRQVWLGTKATGLLNVTAAVVAAAGTGYAVGDLLQLAGGTGVVATVKVATIGALGAVATVTLVNAGIYSVAPTSPASTTKLTGAGDDACTLTLTTAAQALDFPRAGLTDSDGVAISETEVPQEILDATCELAYELSQDADLEAAKDANSKDKRYKAGSVELEFFGPSDDNGRFPAQVQELIAPFLGSNAIGRLSYRSAADEGSSFTDCRSYGRTDGF